MQLIGSTTLALLPFAPWTVASFVPSIGEPDNGLHQPDCSKNKRTSDNLQCLPTNSSEKGVFPNASLAVSPLGFAVNWTIPAFGREFTIAIDALHIRWSNSVTVYHQANESSTNATLLDVFREMKNLTAAQRVATVSEQVRGQSLYIRRSLNLPSSTKVRLDATEHRSRRRREEGHPDAAYSRPGAHVPRAADDGSPGGSSSSSQDVSLTDSSQPPNVPLATVATQLLQEATGIILTEVPIRRMLGAAFVGAFEVKVLSHLSGSEEGSLAVFEALALWAAISSLLALVLQDHKIDAMGAVLSIVLIQAVLLAFHAVSMTLQKFGAIGPSARLSPRDRTKLNAFYYDSDKMSLAELYEVAVIMSKTISTPQGSRTPRRSPLEGGGGSDGAILSQSAAETQLVRGPEVPLDQTLAVGPDDHTSYLGTQIAEGSSSTITFPSPEMARLLFGREIGQ